MPSRGFTLVEMMVAVAVLAIMLAIGMPAFGGLVDNQRMDSSVDTLLRSIHFTRSEAIRRNRHVTMAPDDGRWDAGWVIFVDENDDGVHDPGEPLLREERLGGIIPIQANTNIATYVRYNRQGESELLNGGFQSGTFSFCPNRAGAKGRQLIINRVGRARVQQAEVTGCP